MKILIFDEKGGKTDPQAEYFVLRLDMENIKDDNDTAHRIACRNAIISYALSIKKTNPKLAKKIFKKYEQE